MLWKDPMLGHFFHGHFTLGALSPGSIIQYMGLAIDDVSPRWHLAAGSLLWTFGNEGHSTRSIQHMNHFTSTQLTFQLFFPWTFHIDNIYSVDISIWDILSLNIALFPRYYSLETIRTVNILSLDEKPLEAPPPPLPLTAVLDLLPSMYHRFYPNLATSLAKSMFIITSLVWTKLIMTPYLAENLFLTLRQFYEM